MRYIHPADEYGSLAKTSRRSSKGGPDGIDLEPRKRLTIFTGIDGSRSALLMERLTWNSGTLRSTLLGVSRGVICFWLGPGVHSCCQHLRLSLFSGGGSVAGPCCSSSPQRMPSQINEVWHMSYGPSGICAEQPGWITVAIIGLAFATILACGQRCPCLLSTSRVPGIGFPEVGLWALAAGRPLEDSPQLASMH